MGVWGGMSGWCIPTPAPGVWGAGTVDLEKPLCGPLYSFLVQPFPREETNSACGFPIPAAIHVLPHLEAWSSVLPFLYTLWSHLSSS